MGTSLGYVAPNSKKHNSQTFLHLRRQITITMAAHDFGQWNGQDITIQELNDLIHQKLYLLVAAGQESHLTNIQVETAVMETPDVIPGAHGRPYIVVTTTARGSHASGGGKLWDFTVIIDHVSGLGYIDAFVAAFTQFV